VLRPHFGLRAEAALARRLPWSTLSFRTRPQAVSIPVVSRGKVFLKYWAPVLVWMAVIFVGSSDAGSTRRSSRIIGPILRWLKPDISQESIERVQLVARKGMHMTEYAAFALLAWRARRQPLKDDSRPWRWTDAVFAFGLSILYAVTDEFHQSFVPSRQGQWTDVLIDAAGAGLGLFLLWKWGRWRRRW